VPIYVYGPETHMTAIVSMALGLKEPTPSPLTGAGSGIASSLPSCSYSCPFYFLSFSSSRRPKPQRAHASFADNLVAQQSAGSPAPARRATSQGPAAPAPDADVPVTTLASPLVSS
jgi:hypothetical protein